MLIRILLLGFVGLIGYRFFLRRNKLPFHIVFLFLFLIAGAAMILFPETASQVAHLFGVGRGADLITYIAIVTVLFALLHYYTKFVEVDAQVTRLVREIALLRAEVEGQRPSPPPPTAGGPTAEKP
jgi:hypothetical protein